MPTVSVPSPITGDASATHWAHSADMPGVCGPASSALMKSSWLPERASHPVRYSSQPSTGNGPWRSSHPADVVDLQQEVGVVGGGRREVEHDGGRDQPADGHGGHVIEVLAGDPVVRGVEVGARVLTGAEVVPVPRRATLVVPADLLQLERAGLAEVRRAAG